MVSATIVLCIIVLSHQKNDPGDLGLIGGFIRKTEAGQQESGGLWRGSDQLRFSNDAAFFMNIPILTQKYKQIIL